MRKYVFYELKKSLPSFLIITFIGILSYVLPLALEDITRYYAAGYLANIMTVIGAACTVVPIKAFSYRNQRRSTDLYFSLPISRTKLFAVKYAAGFVTVILAFTAAYVLGFAVVAIKLADEIELALYLGLYFASIIPFYIIYSISTFAFTRANSDKDGVMFIIFAILAVFVVALFLSNFTEYTETIITDSGNISYLSNYITALYYFPYAAIDNVTMFFQEMIRGYSVAQANLFAEMNTDSVNLLISMILFSALSVACTYGTFRTEKDRKAENCNQVSDSIFGYKTMLPLFLFVFSSTLGFYYLISEIGIVLLLIMLASTYGFAAMYKKSFKIGWKFALVLLAAAAAGIAVGTLIYYI